jgi:hypothetical protein
LCISNNFSLKKEKKKRHNMSHHNIESYELPNGLIPGPPQRLHNGVFPQTQPPFIFPNPMPLGPYRGMPYHNNTPLPTAGYTTPGTTNAANGSGNGQNISGTAAQNSSGHNVPFMTGFTNFDGFVLSEVQDQINQLEEEDKYVSGDDSEEEGDFLGDSPLNGQVKSAAIDIRPTKPWKRINGTHRSRNFGKVAINMDTNLSSSTDELLKLAGGGPLQKLIVKLPSYEDSPPSTPENFAIVEQALHSQSTNLNQPPTITTISAVHSSIIPHPPIVQSQAAIGAPILDSQVPLITAVRVPQQPTCRYFANGFCSQGDRCNFAHIENGFNSTAIVHRTRFKNGRAPIPASQYANLKLEDCIGEIAPMCLDQHGLGIYKDN